MECDPSRKKNKRKKSTTNEERWERRFKETIQFQKEYGHCNIPFKYPANRALGVWVQNQRTKYFNGCLTLERKTMLEDIGFKWTLKKKCSKWEQRYEELALFHKKYGHSNVQLGGTYRSLAIWVACQRQNYRKMVQGQPSSLRTFRIKALEDIGFHWSLNDASWNENYQELKKAMKRKGFITVPKRCHLNLKLSRWVATQRNQHSKARQGQPSYLTPYRIEKLESIGFVWKET